ncbi:MAG: CDP-glucose 4,6-dehydratase [Acidobacteriota bacterium]
MTDLAFWRGRRVVVTGHTGFKGAWLSLLLRHLGAEVTGYALEPPSEPSLFDLARVAELVRDVRGDLRDLDCLYTTIDTARPEVVFHLAAQALVRPSYDDPVGTFATNVQGTVHLLDAVRRTPGVRAVVVVTSDKCYENREWIWPYREDEAMGGHDPYSASKGCAELVTAAFRRSFFTDADAPRVASARAGNVVGGGDWGADRLVPDLVRSIVSGTPLHLRSPGAVRPWQHVLEALAGYLLLAERLAGPDGAPCAEGWNFGPSQDDARTVGWIVERMARRWRETTGNVVEHTRAEGPQPHEASLLRLDATKARSLLGWRPCLELGECIDWIVDWTHRWRAGDDPRAVTLEQIERFLALDASAGFESPNRTSEAKH